MPYKDKNGTRLVSYTEGLPHHQFPLTRDNFYSELTTGKPLFGLYLPKSPAQRQKDKRYEHLSEPIRF